MSFEQKIDLTRKCEILLIGNELLIGKTRDLNGYWLGKQISPFGISVTRITTIRDEVETIASTLNEILARVPDYIFTSGGLGPTYDDESIEGIARGLGKKLIFNSQALEWLKVRYKAVHDRHPDVEPELNEARRKMAYIPEGSTPLHNSAGAAPGVLIEHGASKIFVLPGVPRELQAIFNEEIVPILKEENSSIILHQASFIVNGVGESTMARKIIEIMEETDDRIWIKSHAKSQSGKYYVLMHITGYGDEAFGKDVDLVAKRVKKEIEALGGKIHEDIDEDMS
ncbi:MAG: competence/damage-inducible protein A [Promethearchaeota archaeon]